LFAFGHGNDHANLYSGEREIESSELRAVYDCGACRDRIENNAYALNAPQVL